MNRFLVFLLATFPVLIAVIAILSKGKILDWLQNEDPLFIVCILAIVFAACSFIGGFTTNDYSWVDRLWSTLPIGFVWIYVWRSSFKPTLIVQGILVTIWGLRLSFNFARKGGYNKTEDYRWKILMAKINNSFLWQLFHISFICCFQIGLFILFTLPVEKLMHSDDSTISPFFLIAAASSIFMIIYETIADRQQWDFQNAKAAARANPQIKDSKYSLDIKRGFLTQGLFAFSRHPNYFGEIGFWWTIWFTTFTKIQNPIQAGIIGPATLTALFIGSTWFTESISASRYPEYKEYRRCVSPIIPFFSKKMKE